MVRTMLFVGIADTESVPDEADTAMDKDSTDGEACRDDGDTNPQVINRTEDCTSKVYSFCEYVLKINSPRDHIQIDTAYRVGDRVLGKTRAIEVQFSSTNSKMVLKDALRKISLKNTQYAVFDKHPPIVQERRKHLYPVMLKARKEGMRAVLVRDKLFINDRLYTTD